MSDPQQPQQSASPSFRRKRKSQIRQRPTLQTDPSRSVDGSGRRMRGDSSYQGSADRPTMSRQQAQRTGGTGGRTVSSSRSMGSAGGNTTQSGRQQQYQQVSGQRDNSEIKAELDARIRCPARRIAGKIVDNVYVKVAILFFIIINALTMGLATFRFVTENPHVQHIFELIDFSFLVLFTVELCLNWLYRGLTLWKDGWLVFDFVIIVLSWAFESLQVVRAFRIFRALRLIGQLGPLRQLVLAIGATLPRLNTIAGLLLLDVYVFSVLFTELFRGISPELNIYFGSFLNSFITCMEMMTLEDWGGVARDLKDEGNFYSFYVISVFMVSTGFIVFNLVVAVVCDAVFMIHEHIRWLDGKEDDEESQEEEIPAEEIPARMIALTNKFRLMVEYQAHLEKMVEQLLQHMQRLEILEDDDDETVHNSERNDKETKSTKKACTQEQPQPVQQQQQPRRRSILDIPSMDMLFDDDASHDVSRDESDSYSSS